MNKSFLAGLACAGLLMALPEVCYAHGGQYRGPGDVVPPNPGGGRGTGGPGGPTTGGPAGPATPGPAGPATPGPAGPATGGPAGPGASKGPTSGPRGIQLDDDLTRWEFWWEFNKDPYIRLKDAIHTGGIQTGSSEFFLGASRRVESKDSLKPSEDDILGNILPALKKAIDSTDQRDITSSCMVAMAKIGKDHPDFKLLKDVFLPRLQSRDQEIREVAALAIGIAAIAEDENVTALVELAKDSAAGRKLTDQPSVDDRTRSFATYGLGLVAYATSNVEVKKTVFAALRDLLNDERSTTRNTRVAVLNAMGLLNIGGQGDAEKNLMADALKVLQDYWMKDVGAGEQLIQAHCPTAIAKLLGRDHEKSGDFREMFAKDLEGKSKVKRVNDHIFQSCAMALGQMCRPFEDDKSEDGKYSKLLLDQYHNAKDHQTKYFSVLALGQIGGQMNRDMLIREFDKAKTLEKPWVAISMGVFAFNKYEDAKARRGAPEPERAFGETLKASLDEKNPSALAGVAVALGLCQYKDAADDMRKLLVRNASQDELAGYFCIGLALMGDDRSEEDIRNIVQKSVRRPELLKQAAIALGKLGDKTVADELQKLLKDGDQNLAKLSAIASALGFIGDRRTIEPLKELLFDNSLTELSRAFAAVALGGVADKEPLAWNSKIGTNINYRAAVETLTDKTAGILDIL